MRQAYRTSVASCTAGAWVGTYVQGTMNPRTGTGRAVRAVEAHRKGADVQQQIDHAADPAV